MADDWLDLRTQVQKTIDGLVVSGREIGVQVAAYLDGRLIVNAVAGLADASTGNPVTPDTPFFSYSTGKGLTSTAVHVLAEHGEISYDLRLAEVWPEYARHGKDKTTLRHVLTHSAGVPQLPSYTAPEDLLDWDRMCRTIASSVAAVGARHPARLSRLDVRLAGRRDRPAGHRTADLAGARRGHRPAAERRPGAVLRRTGPRFR